MRYPKWQFYRGKSILCGDIPLHKPYIGLIYGRYLQFRILEWPLLSQYIPPAQLHRRSLWRNPRAQRGSGGASKAQTSTDPRGRCGKPKDNISLIVRNSIKPYKTIIITLNHDILFAGLLVCWRFFPFIAKNYRIKLPIPSE